MPYDPDHDYTKNDGYGAGASNPLDDTEDIDNYTIADQQAPTKTAEQIAKENSFQDIPPGDHMLVIHSIPERPKNDFFKVDVGGITMGYTAATVRVRFCLPDNPRATVEDYFVLPPDDPTEMRAYWEGVKDGGTAVGWDANRFYQFFGSIGYPYPAGGKMPIEGRKLGNWKGRTVLATIQAGQYYNDKKTGERKMGRNRVKFFGYRPSEATVTGQQSAAQPRNPTNEPSNGGQASAPAGPPRSKASVAANL